MAKPRFAGLGAEGCTSIRKLKDGEATDDLFAFLTAEPNAEVATIPLSSPRRSVYKLTVFRRAASAEPVPAPQADTAPANRYTGGMIPSRLLTTEAVRAVSTVSSKKLLFEMLSEAAAQAYGLRPDAACAALTDREFLGPTGVGQGVALPHARLDGLERVKGLFIRLERPLDFGSSDRQPVDLIFGLLAPADTGVEHLKALASVSRTFRNAALRAKLRANCCPLTLHAILTEPSSRTA